MTDIRCPVCGKLNSEFRITCENCNAILDSPDAALFSDRLEPPSEEDAGSPTPDELRPSTDQPSFPPISEDAPPEQEQEDQAGWLDMLREEGEPEPTGDFSSRDPQPPQQQPEEEKPDTDWLEKIKRLDQSSDQVDDDSSFPDWLSVTGEIQESDQETPEDPLPEKEDEELPEWLQMDDEDELLNQFLKQKSKQDQDIGSEQEPEQQPPAPQPPPEPAPPPKFPSWASEEDRASSQQVPEELQFLAGTGESEEQIPDSQTSVDPFQMEEDNTLDDLFSEELPSWLTQASDADDATRTDQEITQGELPGWVEAMRPVVESTDTTVLDIDEDYIENYGPLAGIPSILPAEAETELDLEGTSKKNLDLTITKSQQEYITMLQQLIGAESKTKPVEKPAPIATQRMLRWLISLILFLTIGSTIIFTGPAVPENSAPAQGNGTGVISLFQFVDELSTEDEVLIAFDYLPASAGEMNTTAAVIVSHLMEKQTYLSLISTQPTGPALAENFLVRTQQQYEYYPNQQYTNLGYLPGEAAGLLSFVFDPKRIIPLSYDGANAWGAPPLAKVEGLADFEAVIVITDDPNTAIIWIEQVEPFLGNTPLLMVISAQAEPLIQPYYETYPQPLNGYVAGIIDSLKYEQLLRQPGLAHETWLPFNIGILVGASTIFIGGLANGILALFTQHRSRQTGEGQ